MTTFARLLAILFAALLWSGAAHADLDVIRRAAEAGDAEAQLQLGILYQYGFDHADTSAPALTWYILSANQGNAKAARLRDALMANMTEKQIEEATVQAGQFKPSGQPAPAAQMPSPPAEPAPPPTVPSEAGPAPEAAPPPEAAPAEQPPPQPTTNEAPR